MQHIATHYSMKNPSGCADFSYLYRNFDKKHAFLMNLRKIYSSDNKKNSITISRMDVCILWQQGITDGTFFFFFGV